MASENLNTVLAIQDAREPGKENELAQGMVSDHYNTQLDANGGTQGYRWDLLNPYGMPSGLRLSQDTGIISGIPDEGAGGIASLTIQVTDSDNATAKRTFSLTINPALRISRVVDLVSPKSIRLKATGGSRPYTWEPGSNFPEGLLVLSHDTGVIEVPHNLNQTRIDTTQFTVVVKDVAHHEDEAGFSATVRPTSWWRRPLHPVRQLKISGVDINFRAKWRPSLGRLGHLTFWLALLGLVGPILGIIPIFIYAFATSGAHGSYLAVGLLTALAAFMAGCLIGFLFGVPRVVSSGQARFATSSDYSPSSNLAEVSDWLTKLLLGAGLVQLTHLGAPIGRLISHVGAGLQSSGASSGTATVMAGAIIFAYAAIGFLDGYVVTTIWYERKLASLNL
jgi:hypothetical protein